MSPPQPQCVTKPKIWTKPNPKLFSDTNFFRYRYRYFFRYQNFSKPNPIFFFDAKIFRNRYRYFFYTTKFSKPILFYNKCFWNWYRYHQRNMKKLNKSETFLDNIFWLDIVIVIMPRLIAFQPCSTLWVQYR